jgi:hypothetical protein
MTEDRKQKGGEPEVPVSPPVFDYPFIVRFFVELICKIDQKIFGCK